MTLDLGTLALVLVISMLIRLAATTVQFVINRAYRGIGLWAVASACSALGFIFLFLRSAGVAAPIEILLQNVLLITAVLLEYLGTMAFLGRRANRTAVWGCLVAFIAVFSIFVFVRDDIAVRTVVLHLALASVTLLTAWTMWADKRSSIRLSTRFMSAVFLLSGAFYVVRVVTGLTGAVDSIAAPHVLQTIELLVALVEGNLLTFGFIIMIGQRLHADVSEVKLRFELLFNTSPDASVITLLDDGTVVSVNDGFTAMTGYSRDEFVGHSTVDTLWLHPEDRTAMVDELSKRGACDNWEAEFVRKDGASFVGIVSARTVELQGATHVISVVRDISGRKELENELKVRATTDALTGVANRGRFIELAQSELRRSQRHHHPMSVLLLDIDRFKKINDTCGHLVGDSVLVAFIGVAMGIIRSIDVLARFGGDEFVVLLPETAEVGAQEVAERIRSAFEEVGAGPCGCAVAVTACLGVASLRDDDESLDSLLGRADFALYRAKELGRNRVEVDHVDA